MKCKQEGILLCNECHKYWRLVPKSKHARHFASGVYADPVARSLLRAWKYHFDFSAWGIMEQFMLLQADAIREFVCFYEIEAIVPIPLHFQRFAERGFNQAEYIATSISELTDIPVVYALKRRFPTPQSAKRSKDDRSFQCNPFRLKQKMPLMGKVLLVDDVWTTGATIEAAEQALQVRACSYTLLVNL